MRGIKRYFAVIALAVFVMTGIISQVMAGPYNGLVYGRATWRGYFDNHVQDSGTVVLPPA